MEEKSETATDVTEDNQETALEVSEFKPGPRSVDKLEFVNGRGLESGARTLTLLDLANSCGVDGSGESNEESNGEESGEHG